MKTDNKMNHPALKGEVSLNKMELQITPRLRRFNIVSNSFTSCVPNASKEFSWTPKVSFSKIVSQPGMLAQKFESRVSFEQLQGFANTHGSWHLNKQMDMVNSNMQFINLESIFTGNLPDEKLTVHSDPIKFHRVSGILALPDKVEGILSKAMFKTFQIHFISPQNIAHAKSDNLVSGAQQSLSHIKSSKELNLGDGNSSLCLKAEVSLPLM